MSFTGNFFWSPYWTGACGSRLADKAASNRLISELLVGPEPSAQGATSAGRLLIAGAQVSRPEPSRWSWLFGTGGLVTVTPLGSLGAEPRRSVVAIFVDTGDDAASDWGIAGLFGTYSADQDRRLRRLVLGLADVVDPVWIVFAHHPLDEMTGSSRERLEGTLAWLDGDPLDARSASRAGAGDNGGGAEVVFKADDKMDQIVLDKKDCTYTYFADPMYVFMDSEYNQFEVEAENMGDAIQYLEDNMPVEVVFYDGKAISVELPTSVVREIETEPAVKGDTSGKVMKPAKLVGTGFEIAVPLFVENGDKVEIDTRTHEYRKRV